ncbi:HNH endonuclease [Paenibacillus sp. FSL W8-0439]|uniref:HNH endonuclease signature motif containing protein n=1 Tax=Paenibacillus sp. FSL W8-0439 TaxID=2921716 RepID=UPI0030FC586E
MWIEMSTDETHGGEGWEFTRCLWSPAYKLVNNSRRSWAYWSSLMRVKEGDVVLHLKGNTNPRLVGYSIAETDGFVTDLRPPNPGPKWNYAQKFNRVNLKNFELFNEEILLSKMFSEKESQLRYYFSINQIKKGPEKKLLFYVVQNDSLRRQNGAYLSELDKTLSKILFDESTIYTAVKENNIRNHIKAYESQATLAIRVGQSDFSSNVKENFKYMCCFPNCDVSDKSFLIGAHIARWSDRPELRGEVDNGLSLCLMHDKAFEIGLFTLDNNLLVSVNNERLANYSDPIKRIKEFNGYPIKQAQTPINVDHLKHHWTRVGFKP